MKNIIIVFLLLFFTNISFGQSHFAKKIQVATSGHLNIERTEQNRNSRFREVVWSKSIAVGVSKYFWFGFHHDDVWLKSNLDTHKSFLLGSFIRYTPKISERLYGRAQLGYSIGNYCTCGLDDPYLQDGLSYISWGLGFDVRIYKGLYADLGMNFNNIASEADRNYGYNILVVGLNYKFGKLD